ncbi:BTAD domain-containing putative transcriptional regulator [Mycobacterium sp. E3305]|uniref:BTAD domain-containing putative transcriptional regulator n=1 Tax=Mycobacterium sp. E3305 TaxID=1834145 RepID=UPI001E5764F8
MLGLHGGSVVAADTLVELLWGEDPPRTAAKALQTHISSLRRALGDGFVLTAGAGWTLAETQVDAARYKSAARLGRDAAAAGDIGQAVARFEDALALWRGIPELPDSRRGTSEKTRWIEGHAALVEDRADALLATGRAAEIIGELEAAVADAPLRERRWGQLMLALYRAGRQGEALGAYQRARALLADELGVDPGPELRRLEAAIVAQDSSLETPAAQQLSSVTRAVTFLLTDIEGSTAAWEADAAAMAVALARHDELVEQVVTSRGGRLIKTRGEGDATFSVFDRPSAAAAAAIELQDAIVHEPWALREPMRIRVALHTGEVELRDGDYFGRAVNRAARLRSLAAGGQILCSGATAELVIDSLPDDVVLADLGTRQLRNLARPEHVFELQLLTADDPGPAATTEPPLERPSLPAVLAGRGPFVGRGHELERLASGWQTALAGGTNAMLIAGEPGVGKTRLAGEWSRQAHDQGALVIYGRCDEDLGAPYQPFAEALRSLVPCLGASGLRGLRGVEALLTLIPGLTDVLPDLAAPTRADPDTERYALFDAVVALLAMASARAPVVLILDDLHWAAKPTLLLLRHLLRFGEQARLQIIGTYRSTDLDRAHPLAAMLADLHRDGTASRLALSGLDEDDVTAYVAEAGYNDEELARALASVTGGNPFFLIEALRHVDESGGRWDQSTLPQGVREAVSRRLSRLPAETNKALAAAAVVGSRFALELVERVVGDDLVDAFDEACKAGIVIEEPGGRYRFNHALVRQSLLAELPSVRRMRLHQRIATALESEPGADEELLAELAYHYFECAWAGNAAKAVEYCRRAADQAMTRLAYEGAADLYDRALHALEEIDDELPDRDDQVAALLIARCEALLAAGDVASAASAVAQLQTATVGSAQLAAWATCFDGQLSMLIHPERLDEVEAAVGAAANKLAELGDAAGEAKAHTVRAGCLARLGRIGDCEIALDDALTAARRAREHRRVNAVLAQAPLAALWGPNPVPRAGGRCLDVVRLLRITTDSPAVEATSTRCQAVLEAFRGRAAAARRMIDSARRTVTELGLRHALVEVEQFAGIVELVVDEPAAAEAYLRKAYNGFRRMGLDADTAETAALLGRTCLALDRDAEANELCAESERLAGHALKASIAWRTLRARLLSRGGDHDEARRLAQEAVALAERTDALVDHGDACLALATALGAAGDVAGARAAAQRAVELYERKGAGALAERARGLVGDRVVAVPQAPQEAPPSVELDNECVRSVREMDAAIDREAWEETERRLAPEIVLESRRKVVGFPRTVVTPSQWVNDVVRSTRALGGVWHGHATVAVRGERLALTRLEVHMADTSPGAPRDDSLQLFGLDDDGRIGLHLWFDIDDIDAAMAELEARFQAERPPARRLENTAALVFEHVWSHFATRDWDALADTVADDYVGIDHRRVVSAETQYSRSAVVRDLQAAAEVGFTISMVSAVAIRGKRLVLARTRASGRDPGAVENDALNVVEIDADDRIANVATFDLEDIESAVAELDARFIGGEGATYARTWSVVTGALTAHNRRELPAATSDAVTIDHRRVATFAPGEGLEYIRAGWDLDQQLDIYVETEHRVNDLGAVFTWAGHGTSRDGFTAEWRGVDLMLVDGEMISRVEVFEETDLDAAVDTFQKLTRSAPRPENAASQTYERLMHLLAARDWDAITAIVADDLFYNDRRRVVNAGLRLGRSAGIEEGRALVDVGFTLKMVQVLATRGTSLTLLRMRASGSDPETIQNDALNIVGVDSGGRITAVIVYDVDDVDAALAELDARYLAGDAAAHAHTWTVITEAYAALNRFEMPATTADFVSIDHRRGAAFAPGDLIAYVRAAWQLAQDGATHIEAVHRLTELGAILTHVTHGTSQEGFEAEWRELFLLTVEGDAINRCELFDEEDLEFALARFDQLGQPTVQLENAASQTHKRLETLFAARDWDTMSGLLAEDISNDDRRRTVNSGTREGRQATLEEMAATVEIGVKTMTSDVIATRGDRLALCRSQTWGRDTGPEAFHTDVYDVFELNADGKVSARVVFDLEDYAAAMAELDARYLAGDAAAHTHAWSLITEAFAALNRREIPAVTPDWVSIDHRRLAPIGPSDLAAYLLASWELSPQSRIYMAAVHRLSDLGAVLTHVAIGTSPEGFDAEWQVVDVVTFDGDRISRTELFDETDVDAALARFDQLSQPARQLENAATQAGRRYLAFFAAGDWDAMETMLDDNLVYDDRRRVVGAGPQHGRDAQIADMRTVAGLWPASVTATLVATRGTRLTLMRLRFADRDDGLDAFLTEVVGVLELNSNGLITSVVFFDTDDIHAALAELDSRYIAGEAAAHARTWSVIIKGCAALNRHELPATTADFASVDHRRGTAHAPGELIEYVRAGWDLDQRIRTYPEAVHRLSDAGAVYTHVAHGTSREGFDAEWRGISLVTVNGDLVSRSEVFDEADLDAAIARFEELTSPTQRLENAASRVAEHFLAHYAATNWDAMAQLLVEDMTSEDRRRVVNLGNRHGRDAEIANWRGTADILATNVRRSVVATRGEHLALLRFLFVGQGQTTAEFQLQGFSIIEISTDGRIVALVSFDPEDIDSAFAELEARYSAGEARAHAHTWSVITNIYAMFNRHELTPVDWLIVDHRRGTPFASGELNPALENFFDLTPDFRVTIETVHQLNKAGAVVTIDSQGFSPDGLDVEWRMIQLLVVDGDQLTRCELFDETDLDAAIEQFDQLSQPPPSAENAASRVVQQFLTHFASHNWEAMAELIAADFFSDDRRSVINAGIRRGRDIEMENWRATAEVWMSDVRAAVVATRGKNLVLFRFTFASQDAVPAPFQAAALGVVEIDDDNRCAATVVFDPDDVDSAFSELDARYLAGEAAACERTWSAIVEAYAAINRRQLPMMTTDFADVDHRRGAAWAPGQLVEFLRSALDQTPDLTIRIAAVHRLNRQGAVVTHAANGTSPDGFDAEWREILFLIVDGDMLKHCEVFDEADLGAALTRFDELQSRSHRPVNAASQVSERFWDCLTTRDWTAMTEVLAENAVSHDNRRVVNSGVLRGRDINIANLRAVAEVGFERIVSTVLAVRGQRLALTRIWSSALGCEPGEISADMVGVVEIDGDNRMIVHSIFDADDFDGAVAELEARYIAGEAATHAHVWSLVAQGHTQFNRHELPAMTPDVVYIDHRRGVTIEGADLAATVRANLDLLPQVHVYVESVHRLTELGAVATQVVKGTSQQGFDAEWQTITIFTFEGDLLSRYEVFDETELDAAIARFDELHQQPRRLENAATRADQQFWGYIAAGDWKALGAMLADDVANDDRRRTVNAGIRRGRDSDVANMRSLSEIGVTHVTSIIIATRGERLLLRRTRFSLDEGPEDFNVELLCIVELDAENRIATRILFDLDELDAAFEELDARYLAGEAAYEGHTWSLMAQTYAGLNRHEMPPTTPDFVNIDHRRGITFEPGNIVPYVQATWDVAPDLKMRIETVHRLTNAGAVITHTGYGTSQDGFDAEWREVVFFTFRGDRVDRCEMFDDVDVDAALARFDELSRPRPSLENAASRAEEWLFAHSAARDWAAVAEILSGESVVDDRRRVVNVGLWDGRDVVIANMQALAQGLAHVTLTVIATRGERLALIIVRSFNSDLEHGEFVIEMLGVAELDADLRISAHVFFDPDDIDAAFEELDARYLAGEAAPHAHTWSVIAGSYAAMNRRELFPTTPDWVNVDHRRPGIFEEGGLNASLRSLWQLTTDLTFRIEAVHRLTDLGMVCSHVAQGVSQDGFDAEWRGIEVQTVDGDLIDRCEIFDEADLDAALARFDEVTAIRPDGG